MRLSSTVALVVALAGLTRADDFPVVKNSPGEAHLSPMPAEQAASTMQLPAGFKLDLVASEPEVQNPIALTIDTRSRLWIAENYTYSDRTERFNLSMRDRVLIFEDTNSDGRADKRTVFTDQVQMLTSVEVGRGGVWLMCPPQLLFIPDANGDDRPDGPAQVILDGFEVAQDSYHNFANGLRWGPDGWLYGRCGHSCPGWLGQPGTPRDQRVPIDGGLWRYHPDHKRVEVLCHGTVNPWGHDWDAYGELFFINTVIGHLWHMMPGAHLKESFGESMNPDVYERLDMIADHYHFDTRSGWAQGRDGKANDLGGGHAHIGAAIYKGTSWPTEYHGRLLTINMHGRRINTERLERLGAGYVGKHQPDLLIAADPFFRGLDLRFDQADRAFIIDWSDTGECHETTGVHRTSGRIYRLSYPASSPQDPTHTPDAVAGRLKEIWARYQAGQFNETQLLVLLDDPDEHVRVWGIRLLSDLWPLDTILGPSAHFVYPNVDRSLARLVKLAQTDSSGLVHLVLASVLQRLPTDRRLELARVLVSRAEHASDRHLPNLVWYGLIPLANAQPQALVEIATCSRWPSLHRFVARKLASGQRASIAPLEALLKMAGSLPGESQRQIILGMRDAYQGWRQAVKPRGWDEFADAASATGEVEAIRKLNTLFGDGQSLEEIRGLVSNQRAEMVVRQQALQTLIDLRVPDLRSICEGVLDVRILNGTAIRGLATFNDAAVARLIAQKYKRFQPEDRAAVLEVLVSRASFAAELLKVMEQTNSPIATSDLNVYHARQILALGDDQLTARLKAVWGELRETPAARQERITELKRELTGQAIQQADLAAGRRLFMKNCSQCHLLYGQGQAIGPELTGSQRTNLDYLLENIVDPSAQVGKSYRMTRLLTTDGRALSGLVVSRNEQALVLQTQASQETIALDEIERLEETSLSPMPEGILDQLSPNQVRDLIAYLMHPVQVALP